MVADARRADHREKWPNVGEIIKRQIRTGCSRQLLLNRLPIIGFVRNYKASNLYLDFIAGVTVGLTAIPQGIAYAVVAGLEPQVRDILIFSIEKFKFIINILLVWPLL